MNPSTNQYEYGTNIGGWQESEMRHIINTIIYDKIPKVLKNSIIDITVVSSYGGTEGEANFTTIDKLYLLSPKEIGFEVDKDTAYDNTRVLDYYYYNNNNESRIKKYNNANTIWLLRSAYYYSNYTHYFYRVYSDGTCDSGTACVISGVSLAFRIG